MVTTTRSSSGDYEDLLALLGHVFQVALTCRRKRWNSRIGEGAMHYTAPHST
jgi:hypothetical protein